MMNRSLRYRLRKLEGRFAPEGKTPGVAIRLVDANKEITGTVYWESGEWKRWYAPGHEPSSSSIEREHTGLKENVQMIAGDRR